MTTFMNDVLCVLQEKGYNTHCHLFDALSKTVERNSKYVTCKVFAYKWSGLFLLTAIPLISALLSILINHNGDSPIWMPTNIVFPLSLFLTFFTILNSIFRPSLRFREACLIGIGIERFRVDFLIDLKRLPPNDEPALLDLIDKKGKEFEAYQIQLIGLFMPMEATAQHDPTSDTKSGKGTAPQINKSEVKPGTNEAAKKKIDPLEPTDARDSK